MAHTSSAVVQARDCAKVGMFWRVRTLWKKESGSIRTAQARGPNLVKALKNGVSCWNESRRAEWKYVACSSSGMILRVRTMRELFVRRRSNRDLEGVSLQNVSWSRRMLLLR